MSAKGLLAVVIATVTLTLAGCSRDEPVAKGDGGGTTTIAVIPKGTAHVFWQSVHAGARTAARELGVSVAWQGPQTETMKDQQVSIVQDFIARKVDGIVLAPQDENALVPVAEEVGRAGIPLVIFDSAIASEQYVSFVATDNYRGEAEAARRMAKLLNNKGTVIVIKVDPGSASTNAREKGFEETLAKEFPEITIVGSQYGYSDRMKSRAAAEDLLAKHPDVSGVFGPNESSTFGALLALQARNLAGKKAFVGFDSSPELVEALGKNEINALVLQNPFNMGYQSVKAVVDHLRGKEVPKRIDTGVYLVTHDNMDEPENKKLLSPDLSILD